MFLFPGQQGLLLENVRATVDDEVLRGLLQGRCHQELLDKPGF
jgi:hypothetical protein